MKKRGSTDEKSADSSVDYPALTERLAQKPSKKQAQRGSNSCPQRVDRLTPCQLVHPNVDRMFAQTGWFAGANLNFFTRGTPRVKKLRFLTANQPVWAAKPPRVKKLSSQLPLKATAPIAPQPRLLLLAHEPLTAISSSRETGRSRSLICLLL
ncbi:hypothetical protein PCANC_03868 [Puccinia coronata f. sp. avenae]|uniref:Uncharacterized protein n=1 Tax=Puccinia coronata f. sp. avenae TaxID=200324 RepID=A0A2N5W1F5_9BASI|nr:hypothetical protein PCANC_03868 [Puccinia coronata f. sp. avenae]